MNLIVLLLFSFKITIIKLEIAASIKGASKEYKTGDTVITALQPTTFDFIKKELTLIIGPSGSGKTTLLSLLGCVIFPTIGEIYIDNRLVNNLSDKELAGVRLKYIGFVFQSFNLLAPLNVLENVMHPLRLSGTGKKEANIKAEEALKKVTMESRLKKGLDADIRFVGSDSVVAKGKVIFLSPYLKKKSLFSQKANEQKDRLIREVRIKLEGDNGLILNSKVESVIKLKNNQL